MITRDEAKAVIKLDLNETTYDVYIDRIILSIPLEINAWCGQPIIRASSTLEFEGDGAQELLIKKFPVYQVVTLKYRDKPTDSWIDVSSSEYALFQKEGLDYLYYEGYYTAPYYQLIYTSGFEFVPLDVKNVALEMVVQHWTESNHSDPASLMIQSKSISEAGKTINYSYVKDWKPNWRRVLGKYRTYFL